MNTPVPWQELGMGDALGGFSPCPKRKNIHMGSCPRIFAQYYALYHRVGYIPYISLAKFCPPLIPYICGIFFPGLRFAAWVSGGPGSKHSFRIPTFYRKIYFHSSVWTWFECMWRIKVQGFFPSSSLGELIFENDTKNSLRRGQNIALKNWRERIRMEVNGTINSWLSRNYRSMKC